MAHTITLTSKRQATLPVQLCREMGVQPGDVLVLERKETDEGLVWVLRAEPRQPGSWFARLNSYAKGKSHEMQAIRASIGSSLGSGS